MDTILKELEISLNQAVKKLEDDLQAVRSNRPSVALLEDVKVSAYDQEMQVKQLGSLAIRPPRDIEITLWDKAVVGAVVKGIESANLGVSVSNEGTLIRISLPALTDERRNELSKLVKKMTEQMRIQVRGLRDEAIKKLHTAENDKKISEDQAFKSKEEIEKMVKDRNQKIEATLEKKLKELEE